MYLQAMANRHSRGIDNTHIGTTITDPNIDYATVARGFGVHGEGPITDPNELGASAQARDRSGQERSARARRRRHRPALKERTS